LWYDVQKVLLSTGAGEGQFELVAFDMALREAGIADFNLVKVTSIVPPGVPVGRIVDGGRPVLGEGLLAPTIYAREDAGSDYEGPIAAAVGVGIPTGPRSTAGVVYVWSGRGAGDEAQEKVLGMIHQGMDVRGVGNYEPMVVSSESLQRSDNETRSVVAIALFCDSDLVNKFRPSDIR
jgi:arginine decarboxylase